MLPPLEEVPSHPLLQLGLSIHLANYFLGDEGNDRRKHTWKYLLGYLREQKQDRVKLCHEIEVIIEFIQWKSMLILRCCFKNLFSSLNLHLLTACGKCREGILASSESVCFELLEFDISI